MKALTVLQPWASLIARGLKPYEFRGWLPPRALIGQRIAIHAGARKVDKAEVRALILRLKGKNPAAACLKPEALEFLQKAQSGYGYLPLSHILCTAILGEPKSGDLCAAEFGAGAATSDLFGPFNRGWPLTDIEAAPPGPPVRGAQGFWNAPKLWNAAA